MRSFEDWLRFSFDHPAAPSEGGQEWYWQPEFEAELLVWAEERDTFVRHMTRMLREPACLAAFSREQVAQGLWFLVGPSLASWDEVPYDSELSQEARCEMVRAVPNFYERWLAVQLVGAAPAHGEAAAGDELATVCFMWWDLWRPFGDGSSSPDHAAVDREILNALRTIASSATPACIESALHGLNHLHERMPQEVEECIDSLLANASGWPDSLKEYAAGAREREWQ